MSSETAMLLTQEQWEDVAAMCEHYKRCTDLSVNEDGEHVSSVARKRNLADRIIAAAEA